MSDGSGGTYNTAAYSTVGIQAETVHNSQVYIVPPDASPQEKYKVGVRFLEEGVPSRARELIGDAIAHGHDNAEVRFHWVLAMLSARAYHELGAEELQRLHYASGLVGAYAEGEWKDALRVTFELLAMLSTPDGGTGRVLERLRALPPLRREAILHHLDLVLTGGLKDSLWSEHRERAEAERFGHDRVQRVWAYFEPDPIGPRALPPRPRADATGQAAVPVRAGLFAVSVGVFSVLALLAEPATAVPLLLLAGGAAAALVRFGRAWWYQEHRLKAAGARSPAPHTVGPASASDGFTKSVRQSFQYYFGVHVPRGLTAPQWLSLSAGVRDGLVAEIAVLYRESRIGVDRVNWLIRHLAEDARDRHDDGTLFDQGPQHRTPVPAKALCVVAFIVLAFTTFGLLGAVASGSGAFRTLLAVLALAGAFWSGRTAATLWLEAKDEEREVAEEHRAYQERLAARQAAYQSWKSYLDTTRPSELEMETWLSCDKTLFVDEALRHYQLTWRDLITHTILVTPARPYKRGRVKGGPWRYSRYSFRLFLVTQDGVREISTEFDFTDGKRENEQRSNYRFDALSSVQVTERSNVGYDLELVLTNGPARNIRVKDADTHQLAPDENAQEIAEINLNAAGFIHTFRLLEGIAADGKKWIERNNPNNLPPFRAPD
ncbi:hypothetical protein [Streptomyces griseoviridis]|uniref:Tetratricopeptide repeat protein n=1 Tax=Streptomyces griseoviridis TaxID=45398 RepID=A0ABT9LMF0_STRGD|nr:hypothetical protein [Streptomyces griseoviridis]MDP9684691.1 hypothetical protein [Streptomyces griseoviridis]GGT06969.1 hypothetical protein GCM10010240_45360 [Streptomyces griseoviridis]